MNYDVDAVANDLQNMDLNDFYEKYGIRAQLHDWVIEHYRGNALPFEFSIQDAFRDYALYNKEPTFPKDLNPCQLYDEVITLIIEADAGTPFI